MAGDRNFTRDNFAIYIRIQAPDTPTDTFQDLPVQVLSNQDINDVNFTQVSFNSINIAMGDILGSVVLTPELLGIFQDTLPGLPRVIVVVYDVSSPLFQNQNPEAIQTGGIILSVRQSQPNLTELQNAVAPTDLNEMVEFQFRVRRYVFCLCA